MNGGFVVVGKPHPSHPFTEAHRTSYEIARATRIKFSTDENLTDKNVMFAR